MSTSTENQQFDSNENNVFFEFNSISLPPQNDTSVAREKRAKKIREQRENRREIKTTISTEESSQQKKKKRLVRNREAAQASRERKKQHLNELEQQVDDYKNQVEILQKRM